MTYTNERRAGAIAGLLESSFARAPRTPFLTSKIKILYKLLKLMSDDDIPKYAPRWGESPISRM